MPNARACVLANPFSSYCAVGKVTDGLAELKDVDRASVYEAGKDLASAAISVLARGLTLPYREVWVLLPSLSSSPPLLLR